MILYQVFFLDLKYLKIVHSGISDRTMSIDDNYSDFEEDFEESFEEFSEGGQKELTKLERIQMLLRLARDKPLL